MKKSKIVGLLLLFPILLIAIFLDWNALRFVVLARAATEQELSAGFPKSNAEFSGPRAGAGVVLSRGYVRRWKDSKGRAAYPVGVWELDNEDGNLAVRWVFDLAGNETRRSAWGADGKLFIQILFSSTNPVPDRNFSPPWLFNESDLDPKKMQSKQQ